MRSATVSIFKWCSLQNSMSWGTRAMVPSSFMISQMTPAGLNPAMRARSTEASVWPARTRTPPVRARSAESGAVDGSVDRRHEREVKLVAALLGERQADQPTAVLGHEVDGVGRDFLGGHGEVAFVFAVLVVNQDDHAALANLFDGFFDGGESGAFISHSGISLVRIDDSTGDLGDGSDRCVLRPVESGAEQRIGINTEAAGNTEFPETESERWLRPKLRPCRWERWIGIKLLPHPPVFFAKSVESPENK